MDGNFKSIQFKSASQSNSEIFIRKVSMGFPLVFNRLQVLLKLLTISKLKAFCILL